MLTTENILDYCNFVANKEQSGNTLTPVEFNKVLQVCNLKYFKKKVGLPEEYQPGMPLPRQQFEITQSNSDSLSPFKKFMGQNDTDPLYIDSAGYATLPSDYYYHSSCSYIEAINKPDCTPELKPRIVEVVTDAQWDVIMSSPIRPPSKKYPIMNYQSGFIRFAPVDLKQVSFIYLRYPTTPCYDYYIDAYGGYIYLQEGQKYTLQTGEQGSSGQTSGTVTSLSRELEWNEIGKIDIANLVLQHIGINLREGQLFQYSEKVLKEGI
jgi:hypothetical protein